MAAWGGGSLGNQPAGCIDQSFIKRVVKSIELGMGLKTAIDPAVALGDGLFELRLKPSLLAAPQVSRAVAEAVAIAAVEAGLARLAKTPEQGLQCHDEAEWWPTDQPLQPSL
ncbi:MAG: hypothetical protein RLZZ247_340 [Cyanobacteriota bacterium]|jgi:malic enzyme